MPRQPRTESSKGYYHVMQRGTGKQTIFESNNDYMFFLKKVEHAKESYNFDLIAYCLMHNHTHLLIRTDTVEELSQIMHSIGTGYARYFNSKYDHVGYVFQDRFLSEPIESERYLLACVRYIHNNPVKAKISTRGDYQWSSYNEYLSGPGIKSPAGTFEPGIKSPLGTIIPGLAKPEPVRNTNSEPVRKNNPHNLSNPEPVLETLGGQDEFKKFSTTSDNIIFMDIENDEEYYELGLAIISAHLGMPCSNGLIVKSLSIPKRNEIIKQLKTAGLSLKKIEILTGIPKRISRKVPFEN